MKKILEPACGTGAFLCPEITGTAIKDGIYTTPDSVLNEVAKKQVAEYAAALNNPPFFVEGAE